MEGNTKLRFWTPLMSAAFNGHTETVKAILRHHPDVDHRGAEGKTALEFANEQETKNPAIIRLLKAAGAKE